MNPIIMGLGASHNIFPYAKDYLGVVIFGGIFQSLAIVMCYIMTALGNPRITLKATGLGALLNIILDYVLVVYYPLGVKGAAISTVLSQLASFLYSWYKSRYVKRDLDLHLGFSLNYDISSEIVAIGFYQAMGEGRGSFLLSIYRQIVVFIPLMFMMAEAEC